MEETFGIGQVTMIAEFLLRYCYYVVRCVVVAIATQPTELAKEFMLGVGLGR